MAHKPIQGPPGIGPSTHWQAVSNTSIGVGATGILVTIASPNLMASQWAIPLIVALSILAAVGIYGLAAPLAGWPVPEPTPEHFGRYRAFLFSYCVVIGILVLVAFVRTKQQAEAMSSPPPTPTTTPILASPSPIPTTTPTPMTFKHRLIINLENSNTGYANLVLVNPPAALGGITEYRVQLICAALPSSFNHHWPPMLAERFNQLTEVMLLVGTQETWNHVPCADPTNIANMNDIYFVMATAADLTSAPVFHEFEYVSDRKVGWVPIYGQVAPPSLAAHKCCYKKMKAYLEAHPIRFATPDTSTDNP